jgi:hypothetical protein
MLGVCQKQAFYFFDEPMRKIYHQNKIKCQGC